MAQILHYSYDFSYDKVKVLGGGGWQAWSDQNGTDASGYPIETGGK